jgi:hypothetical protein
MVAEYNDVQLHAEPLAASVTILATSTGSTRSSEMRTVLPYSLASARRSAGLFARSRIHEYAGWTPRPLRDRRGTCHDFGLGAITSRSSASGRSPS